MSIITIQNVTGAYDDGVRILADGKQIAGAGTDSIGSDGVEAMIDLAEKMAELAGFELVYQDVTEDEDGEVVDHDEDEEFEE